MEKENMNIVQAVDYAVIQAYKLSSGSTFTINDLFSECDKGFSFHKRQLALVPRVLESCGIADKAGYSARTFSCGRVGGLAQVYKRK